MKTYLFISMRVLTAIRDRTDHIREERDDGGHVPMPCSINETIHSTPPEEAELPLFLAHRHAS